MVRATGGGGPDPGVTGARPRGGRRAGRGQRQITDATTIPPVNA